MELEYLNTYLTAKNLKVPFLEVLNPDSGFYEVLLLQVQGDIEANERFIGNKDVPLCFKKFKNFFELSLEKNVDLAVTPEYSCPWSVIDYVITEGVFPNEEKLWVLGCESITRNELKDFIKSHNQVVWIYEEELVNEDTTRNFFDPLLYIFKTGDGNGHQKMIFTLQFKTTHMSVQSSPLERDNLIPGKKVYVLKNDESSIFLLTLICSDSLKFDRN